MKDTKKEVKFFSVPQWKKEEAYLREQHKAGWRFTKVSGLGMYHFEKCEPEDVVYQLDYNQEGIQHKNEYVQMFKDCGWEYLQDYVGYSYFRKPATAMGGADEVIFCDDESRLAMMNRVFRGRVYPLILFFSCCILPQLSNMWRLIDSSVAKIVWAIGFSVLSLVYFVLFISFGIQYRKFKKSLGK